MAGHNLSFEVGRNGLGSEREDAVRRTRRGRGELPDEAVGHIQLGKFQAERKHVRDGAGALGRREDFDPVKLFNGLKKATEKRDISPERLRAIVDDIEAELRRSGRVEIPSQEIGEMVMDRLRDLDEVAYIRFASVYREFMDLQQVKREIEQVLSSRRP